MSISLKQRKATIFATANDEALFAGVTALNLEAVVETYDRHASALGSLALLIAGDVELAKDAVVGAFMALWRAPASIDLEEQTLRAALAGNVYAHCAHERKKRGGAGQQAKTCWNSQPTVRANLLLPSPAQRDLLGLTLLGEHSHRQAARRVGLSEDIAAKMITAAIAQRQLQRLLDIVDFERIVVV
jgi:DNA-directed RNA polymerase specialized sigma24 family protein